MATPSATPSGLTTLPLDLLVDELFPHFSAHSLLALARTNHGFHDIVLGSTGESVWSKLLRRDFKFDINSSGRRTGFLGLYKRIAKQRTYVWG